jgi:signal transduction histidine kinase
VLDLSKIEAGKMESRPSSVPVAAIVPGVPGTTGALAADKRIVIDTELDPALPVVVTDVARLRQVVYKYLSNAIEFSPEASRVIIRWRPRTTRTGGWRSTIMASASRPGTWPGCSWSSRVVGPAG